MDCERKWNHDFATNKAMKRVINTYFCGLKFIVDPNSNCANRLELLLSTWGWLHCIFLNTLKLAARIRIQKPCCIFMIHWLSLLVQTSWHQMVWLAFRSWWIDFMLQSRRWWSLMFTLHNFVCVCVCVGVHARSLGQPTPYLTVFFFFLIPCTAFLGYNGPWLLWWYQGHDRYSILHCFSKFWVLILASIWWKMPLWFFAPGRYAD